MAGVTSSPDGSPVRGCRNLVVPAFRSVEGAEHAGGSDACTFGGRNEGTWASNTAWPWQRYVSGIYNWYTVQGSLTSAGCWSVSGGPPGKFTIISTSG